jgi:cellobiose-specific phosphotransferase system component IIC
MEAQTYETILIIIGAVFTVFMTAALYIVNQARKDANNNVPPEVAKTLGELIPPSILPIILAALRGAELLADSTPTPTDNALIQDILRAVTPPTPPAQPAVTELVEDAAQG